MRVQKIKRILFIMLCMSFVFGAHIENVPAAITAPQSVVRLDISSGRFAGNKAKYYFTIPNDWKKMVYVNRVVLSDDTNGLLEHLNFYCKSDSGLYKPVWMFSLYVYSRSVWRDDLPYKVAVKSQSYVFAVEYQDTQGIGFKYEPDHKIFEKVWEYAKTADDIKKLIQLLDETAESSVKKVYINNVSTDKSPVYIDGVYYIPLRDVCEALGYQVNWIQSTSSVEILGQNNFRDIFKITSSTATDRRGIKMHIRRDETGDRTYVQTAYITQILKKSVEIDEDGNIYIYK